MVDALTVLYALAVSPGDWLPTLLFGTAFTALSLWLLWLRFSHSSRA